jgi:hypothetical protein
VQLIQLLLPLRDKEGRPYKDLVFKSINASLVERFGGVTAFTRSPAKGTWMSADHLERDDVVMVEVMTKKLDRVWWQSFRKRLEAEMDQSEIVVRSYLIERL